MLGFRVTPVGLDTTLASLEGLGARVDPLALAARAVLATEVANILGVALRTEAPRRSGRLANSLVAQVSPGPGSTTVSFSSGVSYLGFVLHGTAPHEIVAHARALAFEIAGQQVFAKRVHHPGTKPNDFPARAWADAAPAVAQAVDQATAEMLLGFSL